MLSSALYMSLIEYVNVYSSCGTCFASNIFYVLAEKCENTLYLRKRKNSKPNPTYVFNDASNETNVTYYIVKYLRKSKRYNLSDLGIWANC